MKVTNILTNFHWTLDLDWTGHSLDLDWTFLLNLKILEKEYLLCFVLEKGNLKE